MSGTKSVSPGGVKVVARQLAPQAQADSGALREDGYEFIDVLANDLGGGAKRLWSLNQADLSVSTAYGDAVLVDGGRLLVEIVEDPNAPGSGYYVLKVSENPTGPGYDHLGEGQTTDVVFNYAIRLANGAISTSTVTISVTGVNDAPEAQDATAGVLEDATTGGAVTATDADD
ncbi:VCBS domain-containing protein, partial [Neoroseomonas soli]